nr:zinc finger MYM-type protein 1-like [Chrysemys picta bellii]
MFCKGFSDLKSTAYIINHAMSEQHTLSVSSYHAQKKVNDRINIQMENQFFEVRAYWKNVLTCVVEAIVFLAEHGLPFRGSDETVGSKHNGNYLGILELIAKYDPFLAQHINEHANHGKGHTSYLSKTICNELIALLAKNTLSAIVDEIKDVGYFSIDSTLDMSHVDQLTVILRYVLPSRPVEHFMTFLDTTSHTGEKLALYLLDFLTKNEIDISLCCGQSYDHASNMSGRYSGMQTKIEERNALVDCIPCAAHSLNLVGQSAVDYCVEAVSFFGFVQELYIFFSASTSHWMILRDSLPKGCLVQNCSQGHSEVPTLKL